MPDQHSDPHASTIDLLERVTIDVHLDPDWAAGEMLVDIGRAFSNRPMTLPPKWLYDDRGSELFTEITRLPEYYPTEAERSILRRRGDDIARLTSATSIVELGSGTSDKTRTLLDSFHAAGRLEQFVPLDVSAQTLVDSAGRLVDRYDGVEVHGVVGDFTRHMGALPSDHHRLFAFLGGTIGNFYVEERAAFLGALADTLRTGEWLLLGFDLVKDPGRILAAYDDWSGVTEAFIRNVLDVLNREMRADLDQRAFDYVPIWDAHEERIDMRLRASTPTAARIGALDLPVELAMGEELRVEISAKFRPERMIAELYEAGFALEELWTDRNDDFALALLRRS